MAAVLSRLEYNWACLELDVELDLGALLRAAYNPSKLTHTQLKQKILDAMQCQTLILRAFVIPGRSDARQLLMQMVALLDIRLLA
jgi:hypothetical protein